MGQDREILASSQRQRGDLNEVVMCTSLWGAMGVEFTTMSRYGDPVEDFGDGNTTVEPRQPSGPDGDKYGSLG